MNLSAFLANWRTTFFGSLFLFALYVTQYPDLLSAVFEPALAKKIAAWAALLSGFVTFATSKDATVSGNGSLDDPMRKEQAGRSHILPLLLACAGLPLVLAG